MTFLSSLNKIQFHSMLQASLVVAMHTVRRHADSYSLSFVFVTIMECLRPYGLE